jgi:spermidine synthase
LFAASFFLSGGCALIYQVVWSKHLQYVFGSTTEAVGSVLAVFMAGLGAGAYFFGPRIDRAVSPLRLYALFEIGIGVYGLVGLFLLRAATSLFTGLGELPGPVSTLLKLVLATVVLLPPCLLMGATFPALLRGVSRTVQGARRNVGLFYAVNLTGALAGALTAGIVLIPAWGLTRSSFAAAAVNFAIAAVVWFAAGRAEVENVEETSPTDGVPAVVGWELRYLQLGLFVSGASVMAFEIVITRVLALVFGVSAYAFTVVLAVFLLGLGLGALLYERWVAWRPVRTLQFAALQLGLTAAGAVLIVLLPEVPRWVLYLRQIPGLGFWELLAGKALLATVLVLPLATVAGLGLPILIGALVSEVGTVGRVVGRAYLINTAGTIAGSLVTGFALIGWLGTDGTLRAVLFANLLVGVGGCFLLGRSARSRVLALAMAVLSLAALVSSDRWSPRLFINSDTDGSHTVAVTPLEVEEQLRSTPNRVLFFEEGRNATVAVTETPTVRSLLVNAHPDGSDSDDDMATQVMLGVIPLTLHPDPRNVLVIGFGTGVSARSAARLESV